MICDPELTTTISHGVSRSGYSEPNGNSSCNVELSNDHSGAERVLLAHATCATDDRSDASGTGNLTDKESSGLIVRGDAYRLNRNIVELSKPSNGASDR